MSRINTAFFLYSDFYFPHQQGCESRRRAAHGDIFVSSATFRGGIFFREFFVGGLTNHNTLLASAAIVQRATAAATATDVRVNNVLSYYTSLILGGGGLFWFLAKKGYLK